MAHDSSGNNNDGRLGSLDTADENDPTWATGKIGGALSFDGENDFVEIPNDSSLNLTEEFTSLLWIKWITTPADIGHYEDPLNKELQYLFEFRHTGEHSWYVYTNAWHDVRVEFTWDNEWWHLIAMTYDRKNITAYYDGEVIGRTPETGALNTTTNPLHIGNRLEGGNNTHHCNAIIDEVRIYNRVPTSEGILQLYEESRFLGVKWRNIEVRVNGRSIEPVTVIYGGKRATLGKADFESGDQLKITLQNELEEGDEITLVYKPTNQILNRLKVV